jgi:cysteine synthase A
MTTVARDVLATIGSTPLVELRKLVPDGFARVAVKLESANPTGSMKDRMALAMIESAEADGRLLPGGEVIELTGGSTGTSLALVCAVKDHPLSIVTSDAVSVDKRNHMKALGARLTVVPSDGGRFTDALFQTMMTATRRLVAERGAFWTNQFENADQVAGYYSLGEEIWHQTEGRIDAFVQVVGTSGSIRGAGTVLRTQRPDVEVIGVEPASSAVLSGRPSGAHTIEGIGIGRVPPLWDPKLANEIQCVTTEEAEYMARKAAREEGIFAGTSSGANLVAALRVAERLGEGGAVVTLIVDHGMKYLSTDLYK